MLCCWMLFLLGRFLKGVGIVLLFFCFKSVFCVLYGMWCVGIVRAIGCECIYCFAQWPSLPLLWQRGCSWRSLSPPRGSHITNLNRREPPYWQTSPQQPLWLPGNVSGTGTRNISGTGTGNISDTGKELELAASLALAKNWGPKDKQHSVLASSPPLETPGITLERAQIQLPAQQPSGWPGHAHL